MNTKITKIILFFTLLVLLLGIISATSTPDNTTTKVVKEKSETSNLDVQKSSNQAVKEKRLTKEEKNGKNLKKESQIVDVTNFSDLRNYLTSDKNDTLKLNINENIILNGSITLNKAIKSLTITSHGFHQINGIDTYQFLNITPNNNVFINNTQIINCKGEYGGAIYNKGKLTINNTILSDNSATYGGNIYNKGELTILLSKLNNNTNVKYGGAIYNNGIAFINNTNLNNNNVTENGGAIYNQNGTLTLNESIIEYNNAKNGGAIYSEAGLLTLQNNNLLNNNALESGGALYNDKAKLIIVNNKINSNTAKEGGGIKNHHGDNVNILNNKFIGNTASNSSAIASGDYKEGKYFGNNIIIDDNFFVLNHVTGTSSKTAIVSKGENITLQFNDIAQASNFNSVNIISKNAKITNNTFTDSNVVIKLTPVNSIIGEKITLHATVNSSYGNINITGGNLVFKLNGKTLRSDGRFDSNASALKLKVINSTVNYNIIADLYLRNAKNLTASYSGTDKYDEVTSSPIEAQLLKRTPQVTVSVSPLWTKHYDSIKIMVKAKDITKNAKNKTIITDNTKIMIKINGKTLKDSKGNILYVPIDKNAQTVYNYTIPAGMGGITANKTNRYYAVTAIFVGDNYYPDVRNRTYFHVVRSNTTVQIDQIKVTKNNVLSIKATLKDCKGKNIIGSNKIIVKINGKSYVYNDGKAAYWIVKNGVVSIPNIQVKPETKIKRVQIVTGERQAYLEGRNETTNIIRV